jgi:hypothetical protein
MPNPTQLTVAGGDTFTMAGVQNRRHPSKSRRLRLDKSTARSIAIDRVSCLTVARPQNQRTIDRRRAI